MCPRRGGEAENPPFSKCLALTSPPPIEGVTKVGLGSPAVHTLFPPSLSKRSCLISKEG